MQYLVPFFLQALLLGCCNGGCVAYISTLQQDDTTQEEIGPKEKLQIQLSKDFWRFHDKNNRIREKFPQLIKVHQDMTQTWVDELESDDFKLLTCDDRSNAEDKEARELEKTYREQSKEVVDKYQLAHKLATKVIDTHWKGMAAQNVTRESFPEYTEEYDETVHSWFQARSIEDLSLFEKRRPKPNERERGEKLTAELLKAIEVVQQKHESKWSFDF